MTPSRGLSRRKFLQGLSAMVTGVARFDSGSLTQREIATVQFVDSPSVRSKENSTAQEKRMTRFGIQIEPQFGFTYTEVADLAKEAERLGFTALWASDHLFFDARSERRNCLDTWTLITALAPITTRLRLGTLVTCNSYRLPSILAKMAVSVDHLSNGRLEFGIGAGWKELEYHAYGFPFPPAPQRVDELVDTIEICIRMWTEEKATYAGKRYSVAAALCAPKPA